MRFAFLISGIAGCLLVGLVGLASGRDFEPVLRDAALACLVCAFVGRWFWGGLERAFAETLAVRRAAAEAAEAAEQEAAARAVPAVSAAPRAAASAAKVSPSNPALSSPPAARPAASPVTARR